MSTASVWHTPYGGHNIPEAIIWLAEQAEHKATGRRHAAIWALSGARAPEFFDTAYFKVIEEWGKWREAQDEVEYKNRLTVQNDSAIKA